MINKWLNTFCVLGKILSKAVIVEWNNDKSSFKQGTPIPEWLNAISANGYEVNNLVGYVGVNFENLNFWRAMISHSNFKGYITIFEFRRLYHIDKKYHLSLCRTASSRAKKYNIPHYRKTNEWRVTTYAFPIEFLEKICIEKHILCDSNLMLRLF